MQKVGIHDISLFVPPREIKLEDIVAHRVSEKPEMERHMKRALNTTGQLSIHFPELWEDTSTLAAQAVLGLFQQNKNIDSNGIRYLAVGTETTVDHSKPVSAYVQGMLPKAGIEIPGSLTTYQVQHACAGATLSLISAVSMLMAGGKKNESAIVAGSDIAHYHGKTTAEITQGAGAAAIHAGLGPRLIELHLASTGYHSKDVDDFFRPLGQKQAEVKGSYSIKCYHDSLYRAFEDSAIHEDVDPKEKLLNTDFFALHTPFRNMPESAMVHLLHLYLGSTYEEAREYLNERGFYDGIDPVSRVGNLYSGSVFFTLAFLLLGRYKLMGKSIVGKKITLGSYGSGNTMIILNGTMAPNAPEVIENWKFADAILSGHGSPVEDYLKWMERVYQTGEFSLNGEEALIPHGSFYLKGIRQDGYREYSFKN